MSRFFPDDLCFNPRERKPLCDGALTSDNHIYKKTQGFNPRERKPLCDIIGTILGFIVLVLFQSARAEASL